MLRRTAQAEGDARAIVEALALAVQAALMRRHSRDVAADAFCAARLAESTARAFGTLGAGADCDLLVRRAAFEEA
jgi:putative acyl-CoA dehydrogenase